MEIPLLLDTCAAIWFANNQSMSKVAVAAMERAFGSRVPVFVSPITAWELGILTARGRMGFSMSPHQWFQRLIGIEGMELAELSPDVLIASSFLPAMPPRDPADRILAATAREYGYKLVTRDRPLLDYAEQGHIQAILC